MGLEGMIAALASTYHRHHGANARFFFSLIKAVGGALELTEPSDAQRAPVTRSWAVENAR
jgi:hypothetical protein